MLPSFFKFVSSSVVRLGILGIPKKFITQHRELLTDAVQLTVPGGLAWRVELREVDGHVCLQNGFREFLEYYSISVGHFLVFRYNQKSEFHVLIFDTSGTEIDYLPSSNNVGQSKNVLVPDKKCEDENHGNYNEEKLGDHKNNCLFKSKRPFFKVSATSSFLNDKRLRVPLPFYERYLVGLDKFIIKASRGNTAWDVKMKSYQGQKVKVRRCGVSSFLSDNKIKVGDICFFELMNKEKGLLKAHIVSQDSSCEKSEVEDDNHSKGKHEVIQSNCSFKSKRPSFEVSIAPCHLVSRYLPIRIDFYKCYLVHLDKLILSASRGRQTWHVTLSYNPRCQVRMHSVSSFLLDNKIKVGDVCSFELINKKMGLLKAHIVSHNSS